MRACCLSAGAIMCVIPAFGHHNIATGFDVTRTIRISGTVSKVEFLNPHVTISLDVKDSTGAVTRWNIETGSPNVLIRGGITKARLAEGTTMVVFGYPAKDGSPNLDGRTLRLAGGVELRLAPWERDLWNPLRDPSWTGCEEVKPRPEDCIRVE